MSLCTSCELLPQPLPEHGVLYVVPPMNSSVDQMASCLARIDPRLSRPFPGILRVEADLADIAGVFSPGCGLSSHELQDTKAMFVPPGTEPQIRQLAHMAPLSQLLARFDSLWLRDMLQDHRLVTAFQPIVHARDPQQTFA